MSTSVSSGDTTGAVFVNNFVDPSVYVTVIVPSVLNAIFVMTNSLAYKNVDRSHYALLYRQELYCTTPGGTP